MGHSRDWLIDRIQNLDSIEIDESMVNWGWKEPNTHIFIDRFLNIHETLKYIHVIRDPLYMVHSKNQNQLKNWGSIFFDAEVDASPQNIISFSNRTTERILSFQSIYPDRILLLSYDDLYKKPEMVVQKIENFLNLNPDNLTSEKINKFLNSLPDNKEIILTTKLL
jgi:hypothetical protein